jgi:hypothetical protein
MLPLALDATIPSSRSPLPFPYSPEKFSLSGARPPMAVEAFILLPFLPSLK